METDMPRPDLRADKDYERLNPGASADPAQPAAGGKAPKAESDVELPGSQNADLKGAKRDRRLRGATT
jgi:hypothetical protein